MRYKLRQLQKQCTLNTGRLTDRQDAMTILRTYKSLYQKEIRRAKSAEWKRFCTEEFEADPFKAIKKLTGRLQHSNVTTLTSADGVTLTDEEKILTTLSNTFFPSDVLPPNSQSEQTVNVAEYAVTCSSSVNHPQLMDKEMTYALYSMKTNKAPGYDGITTEHIHFFYRDISAFLRKIFDSCLRLSYFPTPWKKAVVIVLPKANKSNYLDPSAYRPISLLPILGKVLEKIILNRLQSLAENQNWLNANQHGFRKGKSTVTALEELTSVIRGGFRKKCFTSCVLLDIKGAFDNAWHPTIIRRLSENNCPNYLIKWINSFLQNRSATLNLNDHVYETPVGKGCPQGSVLSPFLWNIVVDEALRLPLPDGVKIQAFADDIILTKHGMNATAIQHSLQLACNQMVNWCANNHLSLSAHKTELITFTRKHKTLSNLKISINNVDIAPKRSVKYLGVTLDEKLTWRTHIDLKFIDCKRKILELRRFSRLTWGANRSCLARLLNGIVDPMFLYAVPVWIEATKFGWCQTKMRSIQRMILMTTIRSFKTISTKSALIISNTIPLEMRAQNLALCSILKRQQRAENIYGTVVQTILDDCSINPMELDTPRRSFHTTGLVPNHLPFTVSYPTNNYPDLTPSSHDTWFVFTDGSKTEHGTAFAAILTNHLGVVRKIQMKLPEQANIFEAESCAILTALNLIRAHALPLQEVYIYSDAKSVLQQIATTKNVSGLTYRIQEKTVNLSGVYKINFIWIPGHSNIAGNEMADQLARGAITISAIPTISIPVSWSSVEPILANYFGRKWETEWVNHTHSTITRHFFFQMCNLHASLNLFTSHTKWYRFYLATPN